MYAIITPFPPLIGGGFWVAFAQVITVYYAAAAFLHLVVPLIVPVRSVQKPGRRRPGQARKEALHSILPLAVKAAILTIVEKLHVAGIGLQYSGSINRPFYLMLTIVLLDVVHDTWFYWTHRLLHTRPLYTTVHLRHHLSVAPTPFAGYSFHILEAALVFANEIIVIFLFPIHAGLHRIYHLYTTVIHIAGHAGYEIAPFIPTLEGIVAAISVRKGKERLNTVQHHDLHHSYPNKNFSLYFTHWDKWLGTEHPDLKRW